MTTTKEKKAALTKKLKDTKRYIARYEKRWDNALKDDTYSSGLASLVLILIRLRDDQYHYQQELDYLRPSRVRTEY